MCKLRTSFSVEEFFFYERLHASQVKIHTDELVARKTNFLCFVTQKPLSTFKQLIVTSPTLLRGLHTISMTKTPPDGLKPRECKRTKLREPPPVPYIPVKDEVQEEVAKICNMEIKTHIEKDTT